MNRIGIGNSEQAMRRAQAADLTSRQAATTILSPEMGRGKVSPSKVLITTLGKQARPITADVFVRGNLLPKYVVHRKVRRYSKWCGPACSELTARPQRFI